MTTTPAPRDDLAELERAISEVPWRHDCDRGKAYIKGWMKRAALAESELAEVREQLRQMTKDRDDCVEARLHYAGKMCEALGERDELRAELERVKASHPSQWSDGQVLDFLGVALRNVDLTGEVKLSEIRQGFDHVARLVAIDAARGVEG